MNAKKNKLKMFLKVVLLGACACVGARTCAATYTWKADENGNWDGNITDPAHWECDTAGSPEYPQAKSDTIFIPQNARIRITIDKSHVSGTWKLQDGSHVTFVSVEDAVGEMAHLEMNGLVTPAGSTFVLDHAKISDAYQIALQAGSTGIVQNASWFYCSNGGFYLNNSSSTSYFEVSGKSTANIGNVYIGGGNKLVIDDSTVTCRAKLVLGTDKYSNKVSDSTTLLFSGPEPKLVFDDGPSENGRYHQVCFSNKKLDGDVLNLDFLIPEEGFSSIPISIADGNASQFLCFASYANEDGHYGKFHINVLDKSPAVLASQKFDQILIDWKIRNIVTEVGFNYDAIIEGESPQKAREQIFSSEKIAKDHFVYSVSLDCRPMGLKVIIR